MSVNVFDENHMEWQLWKIYKTAILLEVLIEMALLTKEQILAARNMRKTELVPVPEWFENGEVIIIELSGKERDAFEADMVQLGTNGQQKINLRNIRAKLVARCVVNPDDFEIIEISHNERVKDVTPELTVQEMNSEAGLQHLMHMAVTGKRAVLKKNHTITRMFTDVEANDLGDVSASALQRVFEKCQHLSGITKDDVDELVGDLKNDQSADFGLN